MSGGSDRPPPEYAPEPPSYDQSEKDKKFQQVDLRSCEQPPPYQEPGVDNNEENSEEALLEESHSSLSENQQPRRRVRFQTYLFRDSHEEHDILGTDAGFLCAFLVGFLFNWLGLLAVICTIPSLAARCGVLAGFGLSMIKWTLIVQHKRWLHHHYPTHSWVLWIFVVLGSLICMRSAWQYLMAKRNWSRMSSGQREEAFNMY